MGSAEISVFRAQFKELHFPFIFISTLITRFMNKNILSYAFLIQILLYFNKLHTWVIINRT